MDTNKNLFLRREKAVANLSANALDRIICRGLGQNIRREVSFKPILPLVNSEAHILCSDVDVTTREVAFGRWAIPKLKKELLSSNKEVSTRAILSLLDMVHDPEKAVESIRLKVIPRFVRLMMSDDVFVQQNVLMILEVLALQPEGKKEIVNNKYIMKNLSFLLNEDNKLVRLSAAKAVKALATWYLAVNDMIVQYFIPAVIHRLFIELEDDISLLLLEVLEMLVDQDPAAKQQALKNEAVELAVLLEHEDAAIRSRAAAVLAQLARVHSGKLAIINHRNDLLTTLTSLLNDSDVSVKTQIAAVLMYVLCTTEAKLRCMELGTTNKLLFCAKLFIKPGLQLNAIKALTSLAEAPEGQILLKKHLQEIEDIRVADDINQRHKNTLITVINRVI